MTGWILSFRTQRQYLLLNVVIFTVEKSVDSGRASHEGFS